MNALTEEEDVPAYPRETSPNTPTHRRLRAMAGAGNAYVFIVIPESQDVSVDFQGIDPADLAEALRVVADAVEVKA